MSHRPPLEDIALEDYSGDGELTNATSFKFGSQNDQIPSYESAVPADVSEETYPRYSIFF